MEMTEADKRIRKEAKKWANSHSLSCPVPSQNIAKEKQSVRNYLQRHLGCSGLKFQMQNENLNK